MGISVLDIPKVSLAEYNLAWASYISEKQADAVRLHMLINPVAKGQI